jgi:hypothetical protein
MYVDLLIHVKQPAHGVGDWTVGHLKGNGGAAFGIAA